MQSTTPVLLCTAKYYSSTTLYCKVLLGTTPVLLCTAKCYSSTSLYYKVLLQYYSVLQRTTPVVLCTTKYYSVLQSTTPVLLCTTQYYNVLLQYYTVLQSSIHDWCPPHMKRHLECAEQQESPSTFTKYCACHAKWISWLIRLTYETSFRMRGASKVNLEPHQILRLPRKMNLMIDPRHIWNVI